MKSIFLLCVLSLLVVSSCGRKKEKLSYYDIANFDDSVQYESDSNDYFNNDDISVPFYELGGVKYIEVKLNGAIGVKMILDSGCSSTLISKDEAQYLYNKGMLNENDFLGKRESIIADGSIVENMVINIRQLVIANTIVCNNVEAVVSNDSEAPLLLGNEVLNRTASYTVDNINKKINFHCK